jgi:hypothetical protein
MIKLDITSLKNIMPEFNDVLKNEQSQTWIFEQKMRTRKMVS